MKWARFSPQIQGRSNNSITSVSKKVGQSAVVCYYCALSQFFWNRRYIKNLHERVRILVSLLISKLFINLKTISFIWWYLYYMTLRQEIFRLTSLRSEISTIRGHCLAAYYAQYRAIVATAGKISQIPEQNRRSWFQVLCNNFKDTNFR